MNKQLVNDFKKLTGYSLGDIGKKFGVSRQFIHQALNNHSLTYKASSAFYLIQIINEKLAEHRQAMCELDRLKGALEDEVTKDGESHD